MINTRARSFKLIAFTLPLIVVAALPFVLPDVMEPGHVISTDASEWHHTTLTDGTALHVDARSRVRIEYTGEARIVAVDRGSAVFEVAKDPGRRPFIARTHLIEAAAVGTRFGVSIDRGVTITVSEGIVKVSARGQYGAGPAISLKAGEQLRVPEGRGAEPIHSKVNAERELEWATGWLVFEEATIAEVIHELNHRNAVQIEIEQPEIAARPMRGFQRFRVDSSLALARYIAETHDLALIEDPSGSVVRLRSKADLAP
jgi:transmembrane sensor